MAVKYLDETGLAYLWAKIKAYVDSHGGNGTSTPTANATSAFDSSAKMNSTDMTSAQVTDFVDSLSGSPIAAADYIIEQGTSGAWTYRKWNSGIAECWGHFGTTSTGNKLPNWAVYIDSVCCTDVVVWRGREQGREGNFFKRRLKQYSTCNISANL